jgi:hypothetical protein
MGLKIYTSMIVLFSSIFCHAEAPTKDPAPNKYTEKILALIPELSRQAAIAFETKRAAEEQLHNKYSMIYINELMEIAYRLDSYRNLNQPETPENFALRQTQQDMIAFANKRRSGALDCKSFANDALTSKGFGKLDNLASTGKAIIYNKPQDQGNDHDLIFTVSDEDGPGKPYTKVSSELGGGKWILNVREPAAAASASSDGTLFTTYNFAEVDGRCTLESMKIKHLPLGKAQKDIQLNYGSCVASIANDNKKKYEDKASNGIYGSPVKSENHEGSLLISQSAVACRSLMPYFAEMAPPKSKSEPFYNGKSVPTEK